MNVAPLLFIALLLFLSAFFSGSETAYSSLNILRLKRAADEGDPKARRARRIHEKYEEMLSALLVGNNAVNIACASIATMVFSRAFGPGSALWATVVTTVLVFFLGDLLPKSYARDKSEAFALMVSAPLEWIMHILRPATFFFSKLTAWLTRRFPAPEAPSYTEDELQDIIETIEDEGVLEPEQQELVQSAFEFGDIKARDIYLPMEKVATIPAGADPKAVLERFRETKYSRYPVTDGAKGRVIGMLQVSRFLTAHLRGEDLSLRRLILPLRSYPLDIHIDDLMRDMNRHRAHMALILDEKGKAMGIATMEDILEELVGEIYDERDREVSAT